MTDILTQPVIFGFPIGPWFIIFCISLFLAILFAILLFSGLSKKDEQESNFIYKANENLATIPVKDLTLSSASINTKHHGTTANRHNTQHSSAAAAPTVPADDPLNSGDAGAPTMPADEIRSAGSSTVPKTECAEKTQSVYDTPAETDNAPLKKFCSQCGQEIKGAFCSHCGHKTN